MFDSESYGNQFVNSVDKFSERKQENKFNSFALFGPILMYLLCPKNPYPIQ
jgi:hypothetical protein